jgi:GNAT superfamily N-acetyltransferase
MKLRPVRNGVEADHAMLLWLQLQILPYDTPTDTKRGYWWVIELDGRPVAFAGMHPSARFSDVGYLCRSGVVKDCRGQGLQKRLIRVRERKARSLGWRWLITDTSNNPASANSLIACGFQTYLPSSPWGPDEAIYWRKHLTTCK